MIPIFTDEQLEIRDLARDLASRELRANSARWDAEGKIEAGVFEHLAELGFMGLLAPEEWGGLNLNVVTYLLVIEELAWGDPAVALNLAVHNAPVLALLTTCDAESLKTAWLPRLTRGEALGTLADVEWSEHLVGSTREPTATAREERWALEGRVRASGVSGSKVVLLSARSVGQEGSACFLLPLDTLAVSASATPMGLRAAGFATLELDGVTVAADASIGARDEISARGTRAFDLGRLGVAAVALGVARAALEHATEYAVERRQFDRSIAEFGAIREKLAGMACRIESARALVHAAGRRPADSSLAAMAKLGACDAAVWATDEAVQVFGGYGYMRHYPVEKLMRDAQGLQLEGGGPERLRECVVRDLLRGAGGDR